MLDENKTMVLQKHGVHSPCERSEPSFARQGNGCRPAPPLIPSSSKGVHRVREG